MLTGNHKENRNLFQGGVLAAPSVIQWDHHPYEYFATLNGNIERRNGELPRIGGGVGDPKAERLHFSAPVQHFLQI